MDYRQLFESVAQLVRHLVLHQPVMLILEDLHWGDEMSLRLLSFVGRRLRTWPILVVGTAREEDLAGAPILRRTLEDLARDQRLVELRLAPLSKEDTLALVRTLARTESNEAAMTGLAEQVWITSEGNPFAVVEMVRALPKGAVAEPSAKLAVPKRSSRCHRPTSGSAERARPRADGRRRGHRTGVRLSAPPAFGGSRVE